MATSTTHTREPLVVRGLIHIGRFAVVLALITAFAALGWVIVDYLVYPIGIRRLVDTFHGRFLMLMFGTWLPSALMTAAWAGVDA